MSTPLPNTPSLSLPNDGGDANAWGLLLNAILSAWDRHFGGELEVNITAANVTLTDEQAQHGRIRVFGNSATQRKVLFPNGNRTFTVQNQSTGNTGVQLAMAAFPNDVTLLPNDSSMVVIISTDNDRVDAISPAIGGRGGFPSDVRHLGNSYDGPSMFFSGGDEGFSRPVTGIIALWLDPAIQKASVQFNKLNSQAKPTIGLGDTFTTGIRAVDAVTTGPVGSQHAEQLIITTKAGDRLIISEDGIHAAGLPAKGSDKLNMLQYYRNGVLMPFQKPFERLNLPIGAGVGSAANHGQGNAPVRVFGRLRCTGADAGYAAQDMVDGAFSSNEARIMYGGNATQLYYRQNQQELQLPDKTTGKMTTLDVAKWKFELLGVWE